MSADIYTLLAIRPEAERKRVVFVKQTESVQDAARKMEGEKVSSLVVLGDDDALVGILTEQDIVYKQVAVFGQPASQITVKRIMTKAPLVTVSKQTSLHEAASLMKEHRIRHIIVLENGRIVAVVSEREMMYAFEAYGMNLEDYINGGSFPRT